MFLHLQKNVMGKINVFMYKLIIINNLRFAFEIFKTGTIKFKRYKKN